MTAAPLSGYCGLVDTREPTTVGSVGEGRSPAPSWERHGRVWGETSGRTSTARSGSIDAWLQGEVHNAPALRHELDLHRQASPAEILLVGWRRERERFVARLDGVFTLALREGDRVMLCCDPSGLAHLYHDTTQPGRIAFSTHLQTLLTLPGALPRPARRALHEYLRFGDIAPPNTWFEGVESLEAGTMLCWSPSSTAIMRPFDARGSEGHEPRNLEAALEQLQALLSQSIESRLADSDRPAAFLSGGIDSSLICALAARIRPELDTVTVSFDSPAFDEADRAARIAAHLGLRHQVLRFSSEQARNALAMTSATFEQPTADPANLVTTLAFAHCRERFDAVLDGTGADEALGIMPPRHVRLAVGWADLMPRPARLALARLLQTRPTLAAYSPLVDFDHPADTMIRWKGFTRADIEAMCGDSVSFSQTQFFRTFARFSRGAHFQRYSALINAMPCERLTQATVSTGLRVRYPFCSAAVDPWLRRLPQALRWREDSPKHILRALLAKHLPRNLWDQAKHGFDFPLREFLTADGHALVKEHLAPDWWQQVLRIQADDVAQLARRFIAGEHGLAFRVWTLIVLRRWIDHHPVAWTS